MPFSSFMSVAATALLVLLLPASEATLSYRKAGVPFDGLHNTPKAVPALKERTQESLLQADADEISTAASSPARNTILRRKHSETEQSSSKHEDKLKPPRDANWFAAFNEGESSYDEQAAFGRAHLDENNVGRVLTGWNPELDNPYIPNVKESEWFSETPSAAGQQAWQTHYPALEAGLAGHGATPGKWYQSATGHWQQEYVNAKRVTPDNWMEAMDAQTIPASWFDNSVGQYDGFGRRQSPNEGTGATYWNWEERSVNTTLSCKDPGCIANVSLQAPFDAATEIAERCKLSVFFHATDFDEQYSGEMVEWIEVNNNRVSNECYPKASGCNKTAAQGLYPCIQAIPMDNAMSDVGTMAIAAKIPNVVDECPYEGNMLSAVPMVTCMVTPKVQKMVLSTDPELQKLELADQINCKQEAPIRCTTRGCEAETILPISPYCGTKDNKCKLDLKVYQTDYDADHDSVELIEWIKVGGVEVKKEVKPGKNPCKTLWSTGEPLPESDLEFEALKDQDVKEDAISGSVRVSAKISEFVDECAYDGFLFNGLITVDCGNVTLDENPGTITGTA